MAKRIHQRQKSFNLFRHHGPDVVVVPKNPKASHRRRRRNEYAVTALRIPLSCLGLPSHTDIEWQRCLSLCVSFFFCQCHRRESRSSVYASGTHTHAAANWISLSLPSAESAPMLIDQYGETALAIPGIRASSVVRRRSPPSPIKFSPLRVHFPCDVTRRGSCHFAPQNGRLGFFFCSHTQKRDAAQKISGRGGKYIKQHSKKKKPV